LHNTFQHALRKVGWEIHDRKIDDVWFQRSASERRSKRRS
jgi:hypothetical protein